MVCGYIQFHARRSDALSRRAKPTSHRPSDWRRLDFGWRPLISNPIVAPKKVSGLDVLGPGRLRLGLPRNIKTTF